MAWWTLTVRTKNGAHEIALGNDESKALKALDEAKREIGKHGTVTIANRLALKAEDIVSVEIEEHDAGVA